MQDDFEQRYSADLEEPVQVWIFCRLCRCRVQVRTIPSPTLPFRCFCGNTGTFAQFDVFAREDDVVRFVKTFEELYQETKLLMQEAEMPMPRTQTFKPGELMRLMSQGTPEQAQEPSHSGERRLSSSLEQTMDEVSSEVGGPEEVAERYESQVRALTNAVQKAADVLARHDALTALGKFLYPRRKQVADAKRLCYQACEAQVASARDVLQEASARWKQGEKVQLSFPLFKRLVALLSEDGKHEKALEIAQRAAALGIPGYDERVAKLRQKLGR